MKETAFKEIHRQKKENLINNKISGFAQKNKDLVLKKIQKDLLKKIQKEAELEILPVIP